ncbi:MAG TPA: hypothetical protein VK782_05495 [Candidatus Sulfotelmatobacter sp.]|nr:hypothetical protein [Candidatus Sulfotelmatobacter sp.]
MIRGAHIIGALMLVLLLCGCRFFPESRFELAPDSRLPKWFTIPTNLSREEVTVQMSYYVEPCEITGNKSGLGCATFELWDIRKYMQGKKQAVITQSDGIRYFGLLDAHGQNPTMSWEIVWPRKLATVNADIALQRNVQSNPSYVVVNAEGVCEVIEHRYPGDVFYVNDDPSTRLKLGLPVKPSPGSAPSN